MYFQLCFEFSFLSFVTAYLIILGKIFLLNNGTITVCGILVMC